MSSSPADVTVGAEPSRLPASSAPETQPDLGPPSKGPSRLPVILAVVGAIVVAAALLIGLKSRHSSTRSTVPALNHVVPAHTLRLKGSTEAVRSQSILAPVLAVQQVSSLTLTRLAPSGAHVKKGDVLAEFDRQAQMRDSIDKKAEYEKLVSQVIEAQSKEAAERAKDETTLQQAETALRGAELEVQKEEIVSQITAEKNRASLEEAKASLELERNTFDLKRKAAQASIHILEIQRDRMRETMLHAQANAELMQVRSPIDGIAVRTLIWKDGSGPGEVQEGDQLRPGMPFMAVVDPSTMRVRVQANQEDLFSLRTGQAAKIQLDAYPEMLFTATLDEIAPIGQEGDFPSKVRTFQVIFSVQGNDPKLMPDLSAAVDVNIDVPPDNRSGS